MFLALIAAVASLFIPRTRPVGVGFFIGFAAVLLVAPPAVAIWFDYPARVLGRGVLRPMKRWSDARQRERDWYAARIGFQPPPANALAHIARLDTGCVKALRDRGVRMPVPQRQLWRVPACAAERRTNVGNNRIEKDDDGWRWSLAASPTDSTGIRIILQPNSAIKLPGPLVELDGGWLRFRDQKKAPYHTFSTPIPTMRRLRECLLLAAAKEPPANIPEWQFLPQSRATRRACQDFRATSTRLTDAGDPNVLIELTNTTPSPRLDYGEL